MPRIPTPECAICEDWGIMVRPDGRGTEPCPNPIHRRNAVGATAGDGSSGRPSSSSCADDDSAAG